METGKNDTILAIIAGAAGMAVLAVTVFGVLLREPLGPVLQNTRTLLMMAEVVMCFYGTCSVWRRGGAGSQDRGPA